MAPLCRAAVVVAPGPLGSHAVPVSTTTGLTLAQRERLDLAALLADCGPDAPTECAGWHARDLVAHLVLREGHAAAVGIVVPPFGRWAAGVQASLAAGDYLPLVRRFRNGPPPLSALRLPGVDVAVNTFEHLVHHEDVRRAQPGWKPRTFDEPDQALLWHQLVGRAGWYLRSTPSHVRLVAPGFGTWTPRRGGPADLTVTVTGPPSELVLAVHGRSAVTAVTGPSEVVQSWLRGR